MAPSNVSRPSTPRSSHRLTSGGLRQFLGRNRSKEPTFDMLTPSTNGSQKSSPPQISKLAKAFTDSLNTQQVSDFLVWFLYYDLVELPDSPDFWYSTVTNMDMRGWITLGDFLAKTSTALDTGYGFDLVVLDSICDGMDVQRSTVHALLIQFAMPYRMAYSQVATVVHKAKDEGLSYLEMFGKVQAKLHELNKLASQLKPTEGSVYDTWHAMTLKRIHGLLHLVVGPRIANLRSGAPLVTAATSNRLSNEVTEGIKLSYVFEALQSKRKVPPHRYDVHSSTTSLGLTTPPTSPPDKFQPHTPAETERAHTHAIQLMAENQNLRAQLAALKHDKEKLQESNDKLARKVHTLGRLQPVGYIQSPARQTPPLPSSEIDAQQSSDLLQVPNPRSRPRSLSHDAGEKLASELDKMLDLTNDENHHKRQNSEVLAWKYEEVFSDLDKAPVSSIRLSDPKTGELDKAVTPSVPERSTSRAVSFKPNTGRRSGMVFSKDQMNLLAAVRGATPEPDEKDDEGGDDSVVGTPTPGARPRSNLKQMNERAQDWAWE
jgi:hypothetical protein